MYIIMYHYIRKIAASRHPGIKGLELKDFQNQINFFKNNDFKFVSLEDVINMSGISSRSVLLTFDDGYIDHYINVFPLLEHSGITGVFSMPGKILREKKALDVNKIHFMLASADIIVLRNKLFQKMDYYRGTEFSFPSNQDLYDKLAVKNRFDNKDTVFIKRILQVELPERLRNIITDQLFREFVTENEAAFVDELYMNIEQIRMMKRHGMEFAIHGYDHYWMNQLTEQQLLDDITNALDIFDDVIEPKNWCCCYPYGSYSDEVIRVVKNLGAVSGLTTDVAQYHPQEDDIYKIPRLDTNDCPPKSDNYLNF